MSKKLAAKIFNLWSFLRNSRIALLIFTEIILGISLSLTSFLIFVKIGRNIFEDKVIHLDNLISSAIFAFRNPVLTDIMIFISFLGGDFIIISSILIIILLSLKKHKRESIMFFFILIMGFILNTLLKIIIRRPRPDISSLVIEPTFSFPSGHAMNSFVFYALIAYLIFHFTKNKKLALTVSAISILLIILIGISRIYLGVHHPTDVIAGFIAGFWWFVTALLIRQTINFFKLFKETKSQGI